MKGRSAILIATFDGAEMKDKLDFLMTTFESYLTDGVHPDTAWSMAVADYGYVYFTDDGRLPINRAAERALASMEPDKKNRSPVDKQS